MHPGRVLEDAIVRGARGKRRRKRAPARRPAKPKAMTYSASFVLNGQTFGCEHSHRTQSAAAECGQKLARQKAMAQGLEPPTFR
jgi:hypothetical protein